MPQLAHDPLRPNSLGRFIGQAKLKKVLEIAIAGANARDEPMRHSLFVGPPGLGKTTLAKIISEETHRQLMVASGPSITKIGTLATLLNMLGPSHVLFIDEIHRLPRQVEEALYTVMEDYRLDVTTDRMHLNLELPKFTLVGATTRFGMLTKPLRDRFPNQFHLDFYMAGEIMAIIKQSAQAMNLEVEQTAIAELAKRAKKTPRLANNLLIQSRDFALTYGIHQISYSVILGMMELLEIDQHGLTRVDRKILETILTLFKGGPVGLDTLANTLVEEPDVISEVYEPYLIQEGMIVRTKSGRMITELGCSAIGKQPSLAPKPIAPVIVEPDIDSTRWV